LELCPLLFPHTFGIDAFAVTAIVCCRYCVVCSGKASFQLVAHSLLLNAIDQNFILDCVGWMFVCCFKRSMVECPIHHSLLDFRTTILLVIRFSNSVSLHLSGSCELTACGAPPICFGIIGAFVFIHWGSVYSGGVLFIAISVLILFVEFALASLSIRMSLRA
jgi:hypothetical protein